MTPDLPVARSVALIVVIAGICAILVADAVAQSTLDDGLEAFESGRYEMAMQFLRPLADEGDLEAQFVVGLLFDGGLGIERHAGQAAHYYRLAAEQGHPAGALYLGVLLQQGDGVQKDVSEAVRLYQDVVEMPDVVGTRGMAAHALGEIYLRGEDVPRDVAEAIRWFTFAAESGNVAAKFELGRVYLDQTAVQNDSLAIAWLRRASAEGHTQAMGLLMAALMRSGDDDDLIEAYAWGALAAEYDPIQAATAGRFVVRQRLSAEQIAEAERMMAQWRAWWRALQQN